MSDDPARCPVCEKARETEVVETNFSAESVERIFCCNICYAGWTVRYGQPEVLDVETFDPPEEVA